MFHIQSFKTHTEGFYYRGTRRIRNTFIIIIIINIIYSTYDFVLYEFISYYTSFSPISRQKVSRNKR